MKKLIYTIALVGFVFTTTFAQEESASVDSLPKTTVTERIEKSEYQLKLEEKEARKTVKALKKQNKLERSILRLESDIRTDGIKLEKLNERHNNTHNKLSDVDREKLELKMAKLEMQLAKNKEKLRKLRKKV
ncbi:hypothetical protein [Croceivirga thetidis]|uniref:Uncharacterized protein n=1 Tax=Croceivirga thetidis TaxID=2721623 RepID=A0ABX1GU73_9FLAO|nr:hypothetical protein [Croceivirga thetidis]NKI32292.1 hypothetical protein [Croceivirga thetidis]